MINRVTAVAVVVRIREEFVEQFGPGKAWRSIDSPIWLPGPSRWSGRSHPVCIPPDFLSSGASMPRLCLIVVLVLAPAGIASAAEKVEYQRDIKPLLARRCYACHGALKQQSGLRLDTAAAIKEGGDGGPAIEPGKSGESRLIDAV